MISAPAPRPTTPSRDDKVRVMIVDDSVVVRGLLTRWLEEDAEIAVVRACRNGRQAVADVVDAEPDVVVLDIEMPEMDGLEALPLILKARPGVQVVMASTLTRRNAEVSLKAMQLGARDYVPKPEGNAGVTTSADFRREIVDKVKALGARARERRRRLGAPAGPTPDARTNAALATLQRLATPEAAKPSEQKFTLRAPSNVPPRLLAIGSSTGGPQALLEVLKPLGPLFARMPVVITQHMPATFTAILAEHIQRATGVPTAEARDGEAITAGRIYVAPGGRHLVFARTGDQLIGQLSDAPPVNFCKPAVDPMFDSLAKHMGPAVLALVLTGMGSDGANGGRSIAAAGGTVLAQDEATSVVWGMPGATANAGVCSAVLPLPQIAPKILQFLSPTRVA